jgi:hypothetical protein
LNVGDGGDSAAGARVGGECPNNRAPVALTSLQGAQRAVVEEPRLDEQAVPRGEGPDRIEGREGRDSRAAVPALVCPRRAQSVDHHALEGGRAVGRWRHAVDPVEEI